MSLRALLGFRLWVACVGLFLSPEVNSAERPDWWGARQVVDASAGPNELAVANLGQAKWMATQAYGELDVVLPGSVSFLLDELIPPAPVNPEGEWYQAQKGALSVGQLKAMAKPFYDELNELAQPWLLEQFAANGLWELGSDYYLDQATQRYYPWNPATPVDANLKLATLGQLKLVFSLRFSDASSEDGDSLPDLWEYAVIARSGMGLSIGDLSDSGDHDQDGLLDLDEFKDGTNPLLADSDGDGVSDLEERELGTNPNVPADENDQDGDGLVDAEDADPNDPSIRWRKVGRPRFVVIEIEAPFGDAAGLPAGYEEGLGIRSIGGSGHIVAALDTSDEWHSNNAGLGAPSDDHFKTRVWDPGAMNWSPNLTMPSSLRGCGSTVDAFGNVYGSGYGSLGTFGPGMKSVPLVWHANGTSYATAEVDGPIDEDISGPFKDMLMIPLSPWPRSESPSIPAQVLPIEMIGGGARIVGVEGEYKKWLDGRLADPSKNPITARLLRIDAAQSDPAEEEAFVMRDDLDVPFGIESPHVVGCGDGWYGWSYLQSDGGAGKRAIHSLKYFDGTLAADVPSPPVEPYVEGNFDPVGRIATVDARLAREQAPDHIVMWQGGTGSAYFGYGSPSSMKWYESTRAKSDPRRIKGSLCRKGYALNDDSLWVDAEVISLTELAGAEQWADVRGVAVNAAGQIAATAAKSSSGARVPVLMMPVEVVELSPKVKDEDGNDIEGSEKPHIGELLTPFVEVNSHDDRIAHRELKVEVGELLKGKKVTWTLEALPGANPAAIRGEWTDSPTHKDRFEASVAYGANEFRRISQQSGQTTIAGDGNTAIRVNVPPIGLNQVRIKIQIEGVATAIELIDMEVPAVVVIDPGHGGGDSGAIGRADNSVLEKHLVLSYSLKLREKLREKFKEEKRNLRVTLTRDDDSAVDLGDRAPVASHEGADIFISIHFNSASSNSVRGSETYVERLASQASPGNPGANVNQNEDAKLAGALNQSLVDAILTEDAGGGHRPTFSDNWVLIDGVPIPGVKRAGKAVTRDGNTRNGNTEEFHVVKSCLVEVEFISNETALSSVKLSGAKGVLIRSAFAESAANDIYNNILEQE